MAKIDPKSPRFDIHVGRQRLRLNRKKMWWSVLADECRFTIDPDGRRDSAYDIIARAVPTLFDDVGQFRPWKNKMFIDGLMAEWKTAVPMSVRLPGSKWVDVLVRGRAPGPAEKTLRAALGADIEIASRVDD